jgi:hypothetical protein
MICWRIDIQRNFSRYLHGELDREATESVENHVLDCLSCRAALARLRDGHRFAQQMPRLRPERDVWAAIEAATPARRASRRLGQVFLRSEACRRACDNCFGGRWPAPDF